MKKDEVVYTKEDVREFWNRNVCQTEFIENDDRGSLDFFEEAERVRYKYHFYLPALHDWIAEQKPEGKLLEIGCGMGTDLIQLARRKMDVTGIDLTDEGIKLAKKRLDLYQLAGNAQIGDAENIDFPDKTFDVVYSFGVLHHTPDTQKSINEVRRVLKDNGIAVIMLYHKRSFNFIIHRLLNAPFDGNWKDRCPVEHAYTKKQIHEMFKDYSDVNLEIDYFMTTGFGFIWDLIPKFIHKFMGKIWGWHIIIKASR